MKQSFLIMNAGLLLFLSSLVTVFSLGPNNGQKVALLAGLILASGFIYGFIKIIKSKEATTEKIILLVSSAILGVIILFEAFANSLDFSVLSSFQPYFYLHRGSGFILVILTIYLSWKSSNSLSNHYLEKGLKLAIIVFAMFGLGGILSYAGILPIPVKSLFYGWLTLLFSLSIFGLLYFKFSKNNESKQKRLITLLLSISLPLYWFIRWHTNSEIPNNIYKFLFDFGLPILVFLPISILYQQKLRFYTVFFVFTIIIDLFFIRFDTNFFHLTKLGIEECQGFNKADDYKPNLLGREAVENLLTPTTDKEIEQIRNKWLKKDFTAKTAKFEQTRNLKNGDTIKVLSHYINGKKHYGIILIPKDSDLKSSPILLALPGKSGKFNVIKESFLYQKLPHHLQCESLKNYIRIIPSFRGNVVKGKGYSYRSEGYSGDNWHGASEDALMFLEAFKQTHSQTKDNKVIALGASRGATVGLIAAALSDKIDYVISVSTHTKYHSKKAIKEYPLGGSYPIAFYNPPAELNVIRERLIASSPTYFIKYMPPFQIHQGAKDHRTTVLHTDMMQERIKELKLSESKYNVSVYKNEGHGYINAPLACEIITKYATQ